VQRRFIDGTALRIWEHGDPVAHAAARIDIGNPLRRNIRGERVIGARVGRLQRQHHLPSRLEHRDADVDARCHAARRDAGGAETVKRRAQTIGGAGIAPIAFMTITSNVTVTFGATPGFSFTLPAGASSLGQISYVALYDPTANPQPGWTTFEGPGTVSGNVITFTGSTASLQLEAGVTYDIALFTATSPLPTPTPAPTATPTPAPTPTPTPKPTPTPVPTRTPTPTPSPTPSTASLSYEFGLDPSGSAIGIPPVGRNAAGTSGYIVDFGYPSSNPAGFLVSLTEYALQNTPPTTFAGNVFEMTLLLSYQGTGNPSISFSQDDTTPGEFSIESSLLDLSENYTMSVRNGGGATVTTTPRKPQVGYPGTYLFFPSPFSGLTVANGKTVTVFITEQ
jgi:hypothetical protein